MLIDMTITKTLFRYELLSAIRRFSALLNSLIFFALVVTLFPLAISPDAAQLHLMGAGIIWIVALLATLLSQENLFRQDLINGTLEQWIVSEYSLALLVFIKVSVHWLLTALPLILMTPLLSLSLHLSMRTEMVLIISLLLGTPILDFIGAIGAALTVGLRHSGLLQMLLVLPLYVPVLIFATNATMLADEGLVVLSQLIFLSALLVLAVFLAPIAIAAALKVGVSQ